MTDLTARYGTRRSGRAALFAVAAVVLAGIVAWAIWLFIDAATPEVNSELTAFEIVSDHQIDAKFTVVRDETDRAATCYLRALAHDHSVVGQETVKIDSGAKQQRLTVSIRTERGATSIDLRGCSTRGQAQRK